MSVTTVYSGGVPSHTYDSSTGVSTPISSSGSSSSSSSSSGSYTPAQVAAINAAREANVNAGKSAYSGEGATANSIATGQTAPGTGTPLFSLPNTINSGNTNPTTGVVLPAPPTASRTGTNTITALTGVAGAGNPDTTTKTTTPADSTTSADSAFQTYLKNIQAPTNTADLYTAAQREAGTIQKQQQVDTLQGELNAITAKANADKLSLTGLGRGIPEAIIGGQQAEIDKEAAIQALPVAAQLAAAQNDLTRAQDNLNTLFKLRSEDAQNQVTYKNSLITAVYNFADAKQKTELATLQHQNDQSFTLMTNNLNYAQSLATAAISNGQPSIAAALMKLDHNDKNYAANIANLAKGIVVTKNTGGQSASQQQADDIGQAIIDFQTQIKNKGWAGANPDAYDHYRTQLITKYGASAALQLDKDMQTLGITVG